MEGQTFVDHPLIFSNPIGSLLEKWSCDNFTIFPTQSSIPIAIELSETLGEAFKKLISNQILAAPIVDDHMHFVGVISMFDILQIVTSNFKSEEFELLRQPDNWHLTYGIIIKRAADICNWKISTYLKSRPSESKLADPVCTMKQDSSVLDAVRAMLASNAHRVIIVDSQNKFVNIITESRILEILKEVFPALPEMSKSLEELSLDKVAQKDVVSISQNERAFSAFKLMNEKNISGLAVVGNEGSIVGTISIDDLKLIDYDFTFIDILSYPIKDYLQVIAQPDSLVFSSVDKHPIRMKELRSVLSNLDRQVITCNSKHSLRSLTAGLNYFKIHRVFMIDDSKKVIGLLTLHDILNALFHLKENPTS